LNKDGTLNFFSIQLCEDITSIYFIIAVSFKNINYTLNGMLNKVWLCVSAENLQSVGHQTVSLI